MRANEFIVEGKNHPIIVVDVQPTYAYYGNESRCEDIVRFVSTQTGPVLMYVNAEDQMMSDDTLIDIQIYWDEIMADTINWDRFNIVDKGYGYLSSWKDYGVSQAGIIKTIRTLYQQKKSDSRELFDGADSDSYKADMQELLGGDYQDFLLSDPLTVNWISIAQLKKFSGAYLVGGGRDECLWEIMTIMNAFNINYRLIDRLIY